jgi:ATP-dependent Clp protease ATP-binding subunit ClpA
VFERMTDRGRAVISNAQGLARVLNHNYVGTEHILYGLLQTPGTAAEVLQSLDITAKRVHEKIDERDGTRQPADWPPPPPNTEAPFVPKANLALKLAHREALSLGSQYIDTEHILLGVLRDNDGRAAQILHELGADPEKIAQIVRRIASRPPHAPGLPEPIGVTFEGSIRVGSTLQLRQLLMIAAARALDDGRTEIDALDVLLALTRHQATAPLLADLGVDEATVREAIKRPQTPDGPGSSTTA